MGVVEIYLGEEGMGKGSRNGSTLDRACLLNDAVSSSEVGV
jgi:hypothetical protein